MQRVLNQQVDITEQTLLTLVQTENLLDQADQRAEHQKLQDKFTELKVQLEVTEQALGTFFVILEQEVLAEQWAARLPEIALRHKQALERLAGLETEDPEMRTLLDQARAAIGAGDYNRAERLLEQAEARELAGIEAAQAAVERRRLSAAAVRAERAEVLLIRLRLPSWSPIPSRNSNWLS